VDVANRVFTPNPDDIERGEIIVHCFEQEAAQGSTGFVHEQYGFTDEPIYRGALAVLGKNSIGI